MILRVDRVGGRARVIIDEEQRREQLAQGCYADDHGKTRTHDMNDRKSTALPLTHLRHQNDLVMT